MQYARRIISLAPAYVGKFNCLNKKKLLAARSEGLCLSESDVATIADAVSALDARFAILDAMRPIKTCRVCGKKFEQPRVKGDVGYCSDECRVKRMKSKTAEFRKANPELMASYSKAGWAKHKGSESYQKILAKRREKYASDPEYRNGIISRWKASKKNTPENRKNSILLSHYGITLADFNAMRESQGGVCAICREKPTKGQTKVCGGLYVDHDHDTGAVRGLLCTNCNQGLGHLKDDVTRLQNAIEYLKSHEATAAQAA